MKNIESGQLYHVNKLIIRAQKMERGKVKKELGSIKIVHYKLSETIELKERWLKTRDSFIYTDFRIG